MVDPFDGRSEISAEEYRSWIDSGVVGRDLPVERYPESLSNRTLRLGDSVASGRMRESAFRDAVVAKARAFGWRCYFTWSSKHSPAGFPDLFMVRTDERGASRLVAAELKVKPRKTTPEQREWLSALSAAKVETHVWTLDPADPDAVWREIERVLA